MFVFGALASTLTFCVGYTLFRFALLVPLLVETGAIATGLVVLLLLNAFAIFAAFLWFDFYRAWKK